MPRQWFNAQLRTGPVTNPSYAVAIRDRARLTAARHAANADELRLLLTALALWPAQDEEEIGANTQLINRPDPPIRRPRRPRPTQL